MATKKGSSSRSVKTPESFDEVSRSERVISNEEGGLESDVDNTMEYHRPLKAQT
jgi:hypothetical protein